MRQEVEQLSLGDTFVPDLFITNYMPALGKNALKIYLFTLFLQQQRLDYSRGQQQNLLNMSREDWDQALFELESMGLGQLRTVQEGERQALLFTPHDLKKQEIELLMGTKQPLYRKSEIEDHPLLQAEEEAYQLLLRHLDQQYFMGSMSATWRHRIDRMRQKYRFTTELIYHLFRECFEYQGRLQPAYVEAVARDWFAVGLRTEEDWAAHKKRSSLVQQMVKALAKELHRPSLTAAEEQTVYQWNKQFGYGLEVLKIAFQSVKYFSVVRFSSYEELMKEWYAKQLKTPEEISRYETQKRRGHASIRPKSSVSASYSRSSYRAPNLPKPMLEHEASVYDD